MMPTTVAPFTLSRAQVTVHADGKRPQRLGRLAFSYDGTTVELRGRRGQLILESAAEEVVQVSSGQWSVALADGTSMVVRKGCGCGG